MKDLEIKLLKQSVKQLEDAFRELCKKTNRIKADTQILTNKVELALMNERTIKAKELLKEITKINQL